MNLIKSVLIIFLLYASLHGAGQGKSDFVLRTSAGELNVTKYKTYYFASFDLKKGEEVTLIARKPVTSVEISPKSYDIAFRQEGSQIKFRIEKPEYILVRINETEKVFIFAEKSEIIPPKENLVNIVERYSIDNSGHTTETQKIQQALTDISGTNKTLFFPKGSYKTGQLQIKSNSSVYLERGATLITDTTSIDLYQPADEVKTKRFISLNHVENVIISGYGSLDGNGSIMRNKFGDEARMRLFMAVGSKNIRVEGLQFKDPGSWNTQFLLCEDVTIRKVKLLNDIDLGNTDGFDPDASKRVLIEDCFAYCGDDNVAVKATATAGLLSDVEDITVKGCVFLTKKSSLKIGTETRCMEMKNILFEGNDVIESDRGIAMYVSDGAILSHIIYRNNHFERNHPDQQKKAIHVVVSKRNPDSRLGEIKDALIKDCYFENPFPKASLIKYEGDKCGIQIEIDNLVISGHQVNSVEAAHIDTIQSKITFAK